jgi:hypothetical protein
MNSIFNNFKNDIESCVKDFLDSISTEYNLDNKEIKMRWEKFKSETNALILQGKPESKDEPMPESVVIINEVNESNTCSYIFTKGKNSGSCCSSVTKNGNKYCTKHIKFETDEKKDKKKIIPKLADNKKMVLMNLQDTPYWWNKDTGLVFISSENKTVIAKYSDGKINRLSEDDIKQCDKESLKYNTNFDLVIRQPEKPTKEDDDSNVVVSNKKKLVKSPTPLNDDEKRKKLEIYKTNACAKNVEDVLSNILNNDSDEDDDDDFIDEEEEEEKDDEEEEKEELRSENEDDDDDLDLDEADLEDEEEYLEEEM